MILVIDDLRFLKYEAMEEFTQQGHEILVARNSEAGISQLEASRNDHFHAIYLDHDLGIVEGKIDTIMSVVDYMSERAFNDEPVLVETIYVHTSNPVGGNQMVKSLTRYGYNVKRISPETIFIA